MPKVLTTPAGGQPVEITGLPVLPGDGKSGVTLEEAAAAIATLQDADGKPLEGKALAEAAEKFAARYGLQVVNVSEAKVEKLAELRGAVPDRPPAAEVAAANYRRLHREPEPESTEAAEVAESTEAADAAASE